MPDAMGLHFKWIYGDMVFVINKEWGLYRGLLLLSRAPVYFIQKEEILILGSFLNIGLQ